MLSSFILFFNFFYLASLKIKSKMINEYNNLNLINLLFVIEILAYMKNGYIELICGPMFSGKST
jgi:hypothetical protein